VFVSSATNLVLGDTNGASDVFERDLCAGEPGCTSSTIRISVTNTGGQIWGDSWSPDFLRWDGETMPFVTAADGVVPGDLNGIADVYVRHHCPLGAPSYCVPTTRRISVGTDGAQTDGDSYAPRNLPPASPGNGSARGFLGSRYLLLVVCCPSNCWFSCNLNGCCRTKRPSPIQTTPNVCHKSQ